MRVLLIKTSSMGDLIHTMPALTEAGKALPDIRFDWMVEEPFKQIPYWHPLVDHVIPVAIRRWRKGVFSSATRQEWWKLRQQLQEREYDLILDAQGLVKSAFLAFFAKGIRAGLDFKSAREAWASFAYQRKFKVNFYQHAIVRMRLLFSQALGYPLTHSPIDFGLNRQLFPHPHSSENYIVFLHGTTWTSKQWPENYWIQLAEFAKQAGYRIKISGGNAEELARARRIAQQNSAVDVLPNVDIAGMAAWIAHAKAAVAVDTGFGHLAAALNVPTISLYGPTNPDFTGALGSTSQHLSVKFACAPCLSRDCTYRQASSVTPACFETVSPASVWKAVENLLRHTN